MGSCHILGRWWTRRGQPFRATPVTTSLIHRLFVFGECNGSELRFCMLVFLCFLYTLGCWERVLALDPISYFPSILDWQRLFYWIKLLCRNVLFSAKLLVEARRAASGPGSWAPKLMCSGIDGSSASSRITAKCQDRQVICCFLGHRDEYWWWKWCCYQK